jgi:hypothetical protein
MSCSKPSSHEEYTLTPFDKWKRKDDIILPTYLGCLAEQCANTEEAQI